MSYDPATHAAIGSGVMSLNPGSALGAFLQQKAGEKILGPNKGRSVGDYASRGSAGGAAIGGGAGAVAFPALLKWAIQNNSEGKRLAAKLGTGKYGKAALLGLLAGGGVGGLSGGLGGLFGAGSDALLED